jgi:hypothetical protein
MNTIDWRPSRPPRKRRGRIVILVLLAVFALGGGTILSYYVEALWFNSLGFGSVFWTTLNVQGTVFAIFTAVTFFILYGSLLALKPDKLGDLTGGTILINGQHIQLPVGPVLRLLAGAIALFVSVLTGFGMMAQWQTLALYWYGGPATPADTLLDPIFSRPVTFYLFTLPAWQLLAGWLTTIAVLVCIATVLAAVASGGSRVLSGRPAIGRAPSLRAVSASPASSSTAGFSTASTTPRRTSRSPGRSWWSALWSSARLSPPSPRSPARRPAGWPRPSRRRSPATSASPSSARTSATSSSNRTSW